MATIKEDFDQREPDYELADPDYSQGADPEYDESAQPDYEEGTQADYGTEFQDPDAVEASQEWVLRKQK